LASTELFPEMLLDAGQEKSCRYVANLAVLGGDRRRSSSRCRADIYARARFSGVPAAMTFLVNGIFAVAAGRSTTSVHHPWRVLSRSFPKSEGFHPWLYEAALPYVRRCFYAHGTGHSAAPRATTPEAGQVPSEPVPNFQLGIPSYAMCFPVGSAGYRHLAELQDMLAIFLAALTHRALLQQTSAARTTSWWKLG